MKKQPIVPLLLPLLLAGCGGGGGDDDNDQTQLITPYFTLSISDAPVDSANKVCIAIESVSLHGDTISATPWRSRDFVNFIDDDGCLPAGEELPTYSDDDGELHPLFVYVDLLKYQGSERRQLLVSKPLTIGSYNQMRWQIKDGTVEENRFIDGTPYSYVEQEDGTIKPLQVPSGWLKLHFNQPLIEAMNFTAEFDLRHAMVLPGHGNYYKLKPEGVRIVADANVAALHGEVKADLCPNVANGELEGAAFVYLYRYQEAPSYPDIGTLAGSPYSSSPVFKDDSALEYHYAIGQIEPGRYDVVLVCNGNFDDSETAGDELEIGKIIPNQLLSGSVKVDLEPESD